VRQLYAWAIREAVPAVIVDKLAKLHRNLDAYAVAYRFRKAHRTSNMLDRMVRLLDRRLFAMQYFHRSLAAAKLTVRVLALIYNFVPWNPATVRQRRFQCPAHMINKSYYMRTGCRTS
jgi:hypothetical protein